MVQQGVGSDHTDESKKQSTANRARLQNPMGLQRRGIKVRLVCQAWIAEMPNARFCSTAPITAICSVGNQHRINSPQTA